MSYVMRSARCWLSPAVTPNPNGKIVWFERVIGVIYRPETELMSHYSHAPLSDQFDAILHLRSHSRGRAAGADSRMGGRRS